MALTFTVGEVPYTKPFQFADLAELLLLAQVNAEISKADLQSLIATGNLDSDPDGQAPAVQEDDLRRQATHEQSNEDCFRQLLYRRDALDAAYPFAVEDSLLCKRPKISDYGYVYLFLLICSRLASFKGDPVWIQECARLFTKVSADALRAVLKDSAVVFIFDHGSDDRAQYFHTDLRRALRILAGKLNALPIDDLIGQQSASGDAGLDLVAINAPGDPAKGVLAYFGQCAAQQHGWPKKTLEAKKSNAFFHMGHGAFNLLYTPVMYRNATGRWFNDLHTYDCVISDRLRIVRALNSLSDPVYRAIKEIVVGAASAKVA
jgi:hypothetical protein